MTDPERPDRLTKEHDGRLTRRELLRRGFTTAAAAGLAGAMYEISGPVGVSAQTQVGGQSRLVLVQPNEPATLDPQFEQSGILGTYLNPMVEHLTEFDRRLNIRNVLAESAQLPRDGVTYRFRLRSGVEFWDGTPLDANAIKFTYERALNPENRQKGLSDPIPTLQGVDHIRVIDPLTVDVVTGKPSTLAWPFFVQEFILAPRYYGTRAFDQTAIRPMGSGPWRFTRWDKGDRMEMSANTGYWRGRPQIETLIFRTVPDASTRLALLERGEADIITTVNPDDLPVIRANSRLRVESALTTFRVHIGVPCNQPRWRDRRARMALNYAVNVDSIIKFVLGGLPRERTRTPVITPGWANRDIKPYPFDQSRARELLTAANFDFTQPVKLYTTEAGMKRLDVAQAIVADLNKMGMRAEVQVLQPAVFTSRLRAKEFDDLYLGTLGAPSYGPIEVALPTGDLGLDSTHFTTATQNGPRYMQVYQEARVTFDDRKSHELVNTLQALFMEEAAWILLYREVFLFGVNRRTDWRPTEYTRLHLWLPEEQDARIIR